VTYGICYRGVETLDFARSGAVQEFHRNNQLIPEQHPNGNK
jgi:hypothetical protein